jgi:putative SOS response-associated peptidase YedK
MTYAFLTTTPNPLVATIKHERMPVLLAREEEFDTWLRGSPDEAFALAREYPAQSPAVSHLRERRSLKAPRGTVWSECLYPNELGSFGQHSLVLQAPT